MTLGPLLTKFALRTVDEVPGAGLILDSLSELHRQRSEKLGREFLEHVATLLAADQAAQAGAHIAKWHKTESAADAVARGYRSVMDAASPESRLCIAALVAEYVRKTIAPDRRYRRVALLLADATGDELTALRGVCRAVEEVEHASVGFEWAERPIYIGIASSKPPRVHVSSNRGEGNRAAAPFFEPPKALPEALLMLNRHGFSYPLEGFGRTIEIDGEHVSANDSNIVDRGEPVSSVLLLGVCLSVLP